MTTLLNKVKKLYSAETINENELGNSANVIYETTINNQPAVLRISRYSDHKKSHVDLELTWLQYLALHMSNIAVPIASAGGNIYEVIEADGDFWITSAFHKAPGRIVNPENPLEWNETLFQSIGELMGKMHTYSKPYVQENKINELHDWRHNYLFWPENNQWNDPDIQPIWNQTLADMQSLSKTQEDYGLVHADVHHLNFHVDDGKIVLFDFDDCEYSWYAYDIASTLFFVTSTADFDNTESGKQILERFGVPFLNGYRKHAELPVHWSEMIPLFLRYRRLGQYKYFANLFHGQRNPHERYLNWAKEDILSDFPYLKFDFLPCFKL